MPYEIVKDEGGYFIIMGDKYPIPAQSNLDILPIPIWVQFYSVKDMKNNLMNGALNEWELYQLSRFERDQQGRVIVPDLDNLWDVTYPEELWVKCVTMTGYKYHITLEGEEMSDFSIYLRDQAEFDEAMEALVSLDDPKIYEQFWDSNSDSMVYLYRKKGYEEGKLYERYFKIVVYTVSEGDKLFCIRETYALSESKTVPFRMEVHLRDNGKYLEFSLGRLNEAPTEEWLKQFGFCEYE